MNVLDLFSGIGGFSLGLERAGMRTVAFCEIDPFCRRVLAKHWPGVPVYEDIRELSGQRLWDDGNTVSIQVICGGFPCQDISIAGAGAGIDGARSGLWSEYARLIGDLRPRFVIVENVAALLGRGLGRVLGDLAALGYDAEWHCIPASAIGAAHRRDRVWILAYPHGGGLGRPLVAHEVERSTIYRDRETRAHTGASGCEMADADSAGLPLSWAVAIGANGRDAGGVLAASSWWATEPDVGRVAHGVPARVDRLKSLGNAVVPQIPEIIGRAIMNAARIEQENGDNGPR